MLVVVDKALAVRATNLHYNSVLQQQIEYGTSEGIRRQDGGPMNERMKERADEW